MKENQPNKEAKDVKQPGTTGITDIPATLGSSAYRKMIESDLAQRFAVALLANPRLEQILGCDPFQPGPFRDSATVGEHLARHCHRLAGDYLDTLHELTAIKKAE